MPLVFAKSKMDAVHVRTKKDIGCDGIEYQMLADDFDGKQQLVSPALCLSVIESHPAHAIHLPMNNCNIEGDISDSLEYVCQLAEHSYLVWETMGRHVEPIVVLHNEEHFDCLDERKRLEIVVLMSSLIEGYPHVHFVIENTTPFRWLQKMSSRLSSGYYDSPVMIAEYLRAEIGTERIGTCLDTCHAKIAVRLLSAVLDLAPEVEFELSLRKYFERYKKTCKLFHFASYDGGGYGAGHATPYGNDKLPELCEEVQFYKEYGYDCPITLEINEKDLLVSDGYAVSKKNLQKAWKKVK